MKPKIPYIHHIYDMKDGSPNQFIMTIKGKKNFNEWAVRHYFEDSGDDICFRLDTWEEGFYYKIIPYFYIKGKNKGNPRVVFVNIRAELKNPINDIPF